MGDLKFPMSRLEQGVFCPGFVELIQEYPLRLYVNGRELATLVASPHQLNYLVAGFLRTQGFISDLNELLVLGICQEEGVAHVRIKGEIAEGLRPVVTTGCGGGVSFIREDEFSDSPISDRPFSTEGVFDLFRGIYAQAELFRRHGGVHSCAIGDGQALLLLAEDLGRHNTVDRLAGEALFSEVDLHGKMMATSGRISSEMVAKAARLGIVLIASRTAVTDQAVELAKRIGVCLVGYVRHRALEVYSHPSLLI